MTQKIPKNFPKKFMPFDFLKNNSPSCQNSPKKKKKQNTLPNPNPPFMFMAN
jgi:hypothetical protein